MERGAKIVSKVVPAAFLYVVAMPDANNPGIIMFDPEVPMEPPTVPLTSPIITS